MGNANPYVYDARIVRVIDGDTFEVELTRRFDFGFEVVTSQTFHTTLRLHGCDTPEIFRPSSDAEKALGLKAKGAVEQLFAAADWIEVRTHKTKPGIYGRYSGEVFVFVDGFCIPLADYLVERGLTKADVP